MVAEKDSASPAELSPIKGFNNQCNIPESDQGWQFFGAAAEIGACSWIFHLAFLASVRKSTTQSLHLSRFFRDSLTDSGILAFFAGPTFDPYRVA
jgi:hypothetical protein